MGNIFVEKKRVLVVSEDPHALVEIKVELMDYFDVSIAAASPAVLTALEMFNMALVIIYIGENRDGAFSVFADISELAEKKSVPIVFLAEKGNDKDEAEAFALGAVDYTVRRRGTVNALNSRINLRIRASESEKRVSGAADGQFSSSGAPGAVIAEKTILVVDDVELNREIIAGMLIDVKGLALEFAGNGEEAVNKFAKAPDLFSLILMDVQMPVMDGFRATKTIRSLDFENAREVPIIALTANDDEGEVAKYLDSGMNGMIKKPMAYDELINLVTEYCYI